MSDKNKQSRIKKLYKEIFDGYLVGDLLCYLKSGVDDDEIEYKRLRNKYIKIYYEWEKDIIG